MHPAARLALLVACFAGVAISAGARLGQVLHADTQFDTTILGDLEGDELGTSQCIGDLDGDGVDDLLLATWDSVQPGRIEILLGPVLPGPRDLRSQPPEIRIIGTPLLARLGADGNIKLADMDGDGNLDVVVGTPWEVVPGLGDGVLRVLFGPFSPGTHAIDSLPGRRVFGQGSGLGWSPAVGDISGDGVPDLAIGELDGGHVHVLFGPLVDGVTILGLTPADYTLTGDTSLGISVAISDVSGDGQADLLVGEPQDNGRLGDRSGSGAIHVLLGPLPQGVARDLQANPADVTIHADRAGDGLGALVRVGDLDLDGRADIVSSGWWSSGAAGQQSAGMVSVIFGPFIGPHLDLRGAPNQARIFGAEEWDSLGWDVMLADVSGDGVPDLVAGAFGGGDLDAGVAHVFRAPIMPGTTLDLATDVSDLAITGTEPDARCCLSRDVADLDGDGTGDLVFSCYFADRPDGSAPDAGIVYILSPEPIAESPSCDAGGPVTVACDALRRACGVDVQLDGSASRDARGGVLMFEWEVDCGRVIALAVGPAPLVCLDAAPGMTCTATLTVTSPEGLAASCATSIELEADAGPPELLGVPADAVASCDAVPPVPVVTATDDCGAAIVSLDERREPGACNGSYRQVRTWTATDAAGNAASASQAIEVRDDEAPVVVASHADLAVLWAPNHRISCFDASVLAPSISEACSMPVTWRLVDCVSDQADDGPGDGATQHDCVVAPDGQSACVRSERAGGSPSGRRYALTIVATDACGNASAPTLVGYVRVPHDQRRRR